MREYKKINKFFVMGIIVSSIFIIYIIGSNKDFTISKNIDEKNRQDPKGEITFVSNRTDKRAELNDLIKEFENIYPKTKVRLDLIGDAEGILERKASVGELPDVTLIPSAIESKEFNKYFLPIDDLGFNENNIYNYNSGVGGDGKLYSVTTSMSWHGIIYNKKIFNDLGITTTPKTEEEFWKLCNEIEANGIVPVALNYKQSWVMNMWLDNIPYLYNTYMEEDILTKSKDILGRNSEVYKALNFIRQIYKKGYCEEDLLNYDWTQCKNDIVTGKVVMTIWTSDFIKQLEEKGMSKDDVGIFPIPSTNEIKLVGDYKIGISDNTKYPEVAKEFLKFLFEEDRYATAVNIMSNRKNNEDTTKFIDQLNNFDIPVKFQEDILIKQTDNEARMHNKFYSLKKKVGIDYEFVQKYIISRDTDALRKETNEEWKEYRDN